MLTLRNLLDNALTLAELWRFPEKDVLLHAMPIFHTHGLFVATNMTLAAVGSMILLPIFDKNFVIAHIPAIERDDGVPTFFARLLEDERFDTELCRNIHLIISGYAPMAEDTIMSRGVL